MSVSYSNSSVANIFPATGQTSFRMTVVAKGMGHTPIPFQLYLITCLA